MIKARWESFKESGKWSYGGDIEVPDNFPLLTVTEQLQYISENQKEVVKSVITGGDYHITIRETDKQLEDPNYRGFVFRMYPIDVIKRFFN